jgi:hypothetical protein
MEMESATKRHGRIVLRLERRPMRRQTSAENHKLWQPSAYRSGEVRNPPLSGPLSWRADGAGFRDKVLERAGRMSASCPK